MAKKKRLKVRTKVLPWHANKTWVPPWSVHGVTRDCRLFISFSLYCNYLIVLSILKSNAVFIHDFNFYIRVNNGSTAAKSTEDN